MRQVVGRVVLVSCLVAGGACGGGSAEPPLDPTFSNGSRLVARQFAFPGTTTLFGGIYDQVEGVACHFGPASDGSLRCLPDTGEAGDAPERWVLGVQMPGPATGQRLQRHEVHGADGSRFPDRWGGELYDRDMGEACSADLRGDPERVHGVCLPRHADITAFFADSGCTEPVATISETSPLPILAVGNDGALFTLGEAWTAPIFFGVGPTCTELPLSGTRIFRVGSALPAETVAPLQVVPRGDGRLAVQTLEAQGIGLTTRTYWHYPGSLSIGSAPYVDRDRGLACSPMLTVDHDTLCLPADASVETRPDLLNFADPGCTQPVIFNAHAFAVFASYEPGGALASEVHLIADKPSETGYTRSAAGCTEYLKGSGYPIGDTVPLAAFARLTAAP